MESLPSVTHRMYVGGIRVWQIMFQPYHRGFIKTDPTGYALKMSTVYIVNPREVARTISLCLVDFGLFCDKATLGHGPAIFLFA